jgi:hypothetical protein
MATGINRHREVCSTAMALIFGESNPSPRSKSLLPPRGSFPLGLGYVRPPPLRFTTSTQREPPLTLAPSSGSENTKKLVSLPSSQATNTRSSLPPVLQQHHSDRCFSFASKINSSIGEARERWSTAAFTAMEAAGWWRRS